MSGVISPAAALALPKAALREDEIAIVDKTIGFIDAAIRENMKYDGVTIDIPGIPRHLAVAVTHRMEQIEPGWVLTWTYWEKPSKYSANVTQTGFLLQVSPSDDAYRAAGLKAQAKAPPAIMRPSDN